ncbi:uncharacterized [Tachysurus ichikawai]
MDSLPDVYANPGSVAMEMGREAAASPELRNRASLDPESHSEKNPVPGLSEPILPGIMHTDGGLSELNKRRGSTTGEAL